MKQVLRRKKEKGITLIALVITIIVLLILAGVTIAALTGDNGILAKAQQAINESNKGSSDEQIKLSTMEQWMNYYETGEEIDFNEIINLKGIYEITLLNNEETLDCIRENNGELYREKIKLYSETREIEILESRKIAELEEIAIPIYLMLMENQDEIQIIGEIDENNVRVMYNNNLYIITREENEEGMTVKISKDTMEIVEPDDINDWVYRIEDNNTVTILGYRGDDTEIVIPNYINSKPVKRIEPKYQDGAGLWGTGSKYSFVDSNKCTAYGYGWKNTTITKIVVSEGIEELGNRVFWGMCGLTEIKLPNSLKKIEVAAFGYMFPSTPCIINIPINVTEVENSIFGDSSTVLSSNLIINVEAEEIPAQWNQNWTGGVSENEIKINLGVK